MSTETCCFLGNLMRDIEARNEMRREANMSNFVKFIRIINLLIRLKLVTITFARKQAQVINQSNRIIVNPHPLRSVSLDGRVSSSGATPKAQTWVFYQLLAGWCS